MPGAVVFITSGLLFAFCQLFGVANSIAGRAPEALNEVRRWPFLVSIQIKTFKYKHFCTGVIIREDLIVSSADCYPGNRTQDYLKGLEVVAGTNDIDATGGGAQRVGVTGIRSPKEHTDQGRQFWDVALLQVTPALKLDKKNVDKIELPKDDKEPDTKTECAIAGWGRYEEESYIPSKKLREAVMTVIPTKDCNSQWNNELKGTIFCAEGKPYKAEVCLSDTGVPLVCPDMKRKEMYLAGLVNEYPEDCGSFEKPDVFTTIPGKIADWIKAEMAKIKP